MGAGAAYTRPVLLGLLWACAPVEGGGTESAGADTADSAPDTAPDTGPAPATCDPYVVTTVAEWTDIDLPSREDLDHTVQGVGVGDLDGDGDLDALVAWAGGSFGLRNDGAGGLSVDPAIRASVGDLPGSEAVALADLDGDGDLDAMLGSWSAEASVYWNDGTGVFTPELLPGTDVVTYAIAFGDADGDGDLDAYVSAAAYNMTYEDIVAGTQVGDGNLLLIQDDDHHFAERVGALPEDTRYGMTLHSVWFDADGDGDLDLYVGNDAGPYVDGNHLLINNGHGDFTRAADCGCELVNYTMGVGVGDANQDGLPDLYVTDVGPPTLLWNLGDGTFVNATLNAGDAYVPSAETSMVSWAAGFADLDADRDQDLVVTFGQSGKNFSAAGVPATDGPVQPNQVLLSDGAGRFVKAEPGFADGPRTRTYALGDFDRDGRPDLLTAGKYFVRVALSGGGCPPGATLRLHGANLVGAKIEAEVAGQTQTLWHLPSTTSSSSADEVYLGFGGYPSADRVRITWPGGATSELEDLAAGSVVDVDAP